MNQKFRKMTKNDESKIKASEIKLLHSIIQKTKRDKINDEIKYMLSSEKLQDILESKWFGKIIRICEQRLKNIK